MREHSLIFEIYSITKIPNIFFNSGIISTAEQSYTNTSKHNAIVRKLILPSDCLNDYLVWISIATWVWLSVEE